MRPESERFGVPPRRLAAAVCFVVLALAALALALAGCSERRGATVHVIAQSGRFGSIERAAAAADSVDWRDSDASDDDACTESFAASEIARLLPRAVRVEGDAVRLSGGGELPPAGDVVVLGTRAGSPLIATLIPDTPRFAAPPGSFRIRALERDARRIVVVEGADRTGVLYGAYALLERLGLRFYDLNEVREPRTRASRLPASLAIDERPAFAVRGLWAWEPRGHDAFFLWMARNRLNLWTSAEPNRAHLRMLGIGLTGGGHNVEKALFDPEGASDVRGRTRFQAHPEWYGLKGGRRVPGIGAEFGLNFCTSNRDAVAELVRGLIESLERGELSESDVVNLWPLDAGTWCECANCAAQGSPSDRWLTVLAAASDGVRAARASGALTHPVALLAPAYLETWKAPEHPAASSDPAVGVTFFPYYRCYAHALEDSSCTEINAPIAAHLRGWVERWRGPLWIGEYYNVSWTKSLPVLFASVLAADLRAYAAHGAVGLHYMHAPARLWGSWTLQHALYARLAWSPRANLDSLIGDFVAHEHAEAPKDMRAFYASLELATSNLQALQTSVGAIGSGNYEYLLRPGRSSYLIRHLDPVRGGAENAAPKVAEMEQAWRSARHSLDRAKAATRDPAARARLELVERRFEYGRAMFEFYRQILDAALAHHTRRTDVVRERLAIADSLAERLEAITDLVQVSASHANARNGLEASQSVRVYELLRRMYPPASR